MEEQKIQTTECTPLWNVAVFVAAAVRTSASGDRRIHPFVAGWLQV